jgi:DUF1680 family protein
MQAVVVPSERAMSRLRPLDGSDVTLIGGFWADRLRLNRSTTIGHGWEQLERVGTLGNLRLAAGASGTYQALSDTSGAAFPFLDTDVYKWLEAVGWELGRGRDEEMERAADVAIGLVGDAQRPDGYVHSYVQVVGGGIPYGDLAWSHEFYCVGHLIQAAVAWTRSVGDDRLLTIAMAAADHIDRTFGPGRTVAIDGHPEVEMALVELYRVTREDRYLALASRLLEARGHGLLDGGRFGSSYWQDHLPVREAPTVAGHAVRQLYLDCGAVDVAVETGDGALLDAVIRRWTDMVATRSYLTGGLGSRHRDEAFGDPYELPPDRAYAETCAAIASVMLAWRLLLATGESRFADTIERTMLNGVLSGLGLDGTSFFYVNPLQRRSHRAPSGGHAGRAPWYPCACCPPNLMRTLSSWEQYLATADIDGVQLHQFASSTIRAGVAGGVVALEIDTAYPWDGAVNVLVVETPGVPWTLTTRVPDHVRSGSVSRPDGSVEAIEPGAGTWSHPRTWSAGDTIELRMDLDPRVIRSDPRVDATRGCVALTRGPLVYCVETADIPAGVELEDVSVAASVEPVAVPRDDLGPSFVGLALDAVVRPNRRGAAGARATEVEIGAIPYFAWANRAVEAMRVWIPATDDPDPSEGGAVD